MDVDVESIQPGWTVVDKHGEEIGKVVNSEGTAIVVKRGGLLARDVTIPRDAVAYVETGRVELNRDKRDLG